MRNYVYVSKRFCIFAVYCVKTVSMKLNITEGYTYQRIDGLVEVTDKTLSESLMYQAVYSPCEIITKGEAITMGFEELANWSSPDDKLILINNSILLCCKNNDLIA